MDRASVDTSDTHTYRGLLISSHICALFRSSLPPPLKAAAAGAVNDSQCGCARGGPTEHEAHVASCLVNVDDRHRLCYVLGSPLFAVAQLRGAT